MKSLNSFLSTSPLESKDQFCQAYPHPFLLSKLTEEDMGSGEKEKQEEEETESFETEDLESTLATLKFETDKFNLDEILESVKEEMDEIWIIPLLKKGSKGQKQMITVGRTPNNDISLPFRGISKFHAYFVVDGMNTLVVDGGSTNGTFINSKPLPPPTKHPLNSLDVISFANLFHFFFFTPDRLYDYLKFKNFF